MTGLFSGGVLGIAHLALSALLAVWTLLFLFRIVLTWYPQVDLTRGPMRLIGAPTEPLLALTRRLIQPIGGVDVTPVVWLGLISLGRELLVGQQGLISQLLQQSQFLQHSQLAQSSHLALLT